MPVVQGVECHGKCASRDKELKRWTTAGHNDVGLLYAKQWAEAIEALVKKAKAFDPDFPAGCLVETHSLSVSELNGLKG